MKSPLPTTLGLALLPATLLLFGCDAPNPLVVDDAGDAIRAPDGVFAGQGNGAPTGFHHTLIIKGTENNGQGIGNGNGGQTIFVKLTGNTKIMLAEGDTYEVLDADGRDTAREHHLFHTGGHGSLHHSAGAVDIDLVVQVGVLSSTPRTSPQTEVDTP